MDGRWRIIRGDCVEAMATLDAESVAAIVTDPPYHLAFMGKAWDTITPGQSQHEHERWAHEAFRVLKPGGHLLAFGGTRTYHRLAAGIEDAGFEIRDTISWMYGSGFPKSLNVGKAIDKAARGVPQGGADPSSPNSGRYRTQATEGKRDEGDGGQGYGAGPGQFMAEQGERVDLDELVPEARPWAGHGTALKPAHEPIVVARKPLSGTVAGNVLEHGTGALNIDATRIEHGGDIDLERQQRDFDRMGYMGTDGETDGVATYKAGGRWPANVVLDPEAVRLLDEQTGELASGSRAEGVRKGLGYHGADGDGGPAIVGDPGGASRFFYCAKASRVERNAGLEGFEERPGPKQDGGPDRRSGTARQPTEWRPPPVANGHPTVKPIELMRWLVRLVTPPGGTVLDPFTGSGTTGCAAVLEGFDFVGIEREGEYANIAEARIGWWEKHRGDGLAAQVLTAGAERDAVEATGQLSLDGEAA